MFHFSTIARRLYQGLTVGLLLVMAACGGRIELMSSMPESEANEVLAALQNAGIPAEKIPGKEGNVGLAVDGQQAARAIDILKSKGLPRERFAGMGEVFKKEGLISSPLEERARYLYALSQELSGTLARLDGVVAARVHVVLPERGSAGDPNLPSSAAVFIKHQENHNLDTVQPQIRRLVTNSIPGLTPEKVSIILVAAQPPKASEQVSWTSVWGFSVETQQASALRATLVILIGLLVLSLGGLGFLAYRFAWPAWQARQKGITTVTER